MEQTAEYLTWMRREFLLNKSHHFPVVSWEERAFAEDASGEPGGCVWPPRSYSCSFCRREFRSAQALGGHMNVHRRDRARLKQSLCSVQEEEAAAGLKQTIQIPSTKKICKAVNVSDSNGSVSKVIQKENEKLMMFKEDDEDEDVDQAGVETGLAVGWSMNQTGLGCGSEKAYRLINKRPRITGNLNRLPRPPFAPAADTKLVQTGKGLELDLELRLAW